MPAAPTQGSVGLTDSAYRQTRETGRGNDYNSGQGVEALKIVRDGVSEIGEWVGALDKGGRRRPQPYDKVIKSARELDPLLKSLTGDQLLCAMEATLQSRMPNYWHMVDTGWYGAPQGNPLEKRMGKSMGFSNNLGRQYFGPTFSGDATMSDLAKAMATQNIGGSYGDDTPLRLQNLDATMTSVLYEEQHFVKWNWLERVPSIQPYYEWVDRLSYGDDRSQPAFVEGGTPAGGTASFSRNGVYVRYFGVRRGITHQMALTGQLGGSMVDPVAEENRDGAMQLLARCERNFVWGDHNITDNNGNTVNYDGLVLALQNGVQFVGASQSNGMPNGYSAGLNILDFQGTYPDFGIFESVGRLMAEAGFVTNFRNMRAFMSPTVIEDLAKIQLSEQIQVLGQRPYTGWYQGAPLVGYQTNFGFIPFTYDIFLRRAGMTDQPPQTSATQAPGAPNSSSTVAAASPTGNQTSEFYAAPAGGGTDAGTYYYWLTAGNDNGESTAISLGAVAVAVGQVVNATVVPGPSNGNPCTYFRLYRGTVNSQTDPGTGCIATFASAGPTSSTSVTYTDTNYWRPQTGMLLFVERTPSNLCIAQMAPMLKWPLAITSTTVEWLLLLYHTLVVKAPQRQFLVRNIGRLNTRGLPSLPA